jgi:hypothetical protein
MEPLGHENVQWMGLAVPSALSGEDFEAQYAVQNPSGGGEGAQFLVFKEIGKAKIDVSSVKGRACADQKPFDLLS